MTRLTLRYLTSADLPFADSLRAIADWNQTLADWQRFIDLSPCGCLLAECEGKPVGTATTVAYGHELGWIGMMLVRPDFRRRGIARVLMDHCIEILRFAGVKTIKLDATPEGREVYLKLGFKDEYRITRYETENASPLNNISGLRRASDNDLPAIIALDQAATGARREDLLRRLIADSSQSLVSQIGNEINGFGIRRPGARASYVGPVVAKNSEAAQQIASALLDGKIFCDLPDTNQVAPQWATSHGLKPQRTLTRMFLGENLLAPEAQTYFAIASPDLG